MRYLILVCLAFAYLTGCSSCVRESAGIQVDRKLAPQVPSDTGVLFGADIAKLKAAPLYRRHAAGAEIPFLDAASERLGVDPRRDLASALVYFTPQHQPVALLRGSFSNEALRTRLLSLGAKSSRENADVLQTGAERVLFTAPGIIAVGPTVAFAHTADVQRGLPRSIYARLGTLPKSDQLWLISTEGLASLNLPADSNIGSAVGTLAGYVTGATAGLGVDEGIHLQADMSCSSVKGAEQVRDALRGFVALGRLTTRTGQTDLLHIYDAIHIDNNRDLVHIHADLPPDLSDKALAYISSFHTKLQR